MSDNPFEPNGDGPTFYDRITRQRRLYYQQVGSPPTEYELPPVEVLSVESEDEPYERERGFKRAGDSLKVETGHIEKPLLLVIDNVTRWKKPVQPSNEERELLAATQIEVWCGSQLLSILQPGCSFEVWKPPADLKLTVSPTNQYARVRFIAFPGAD
jgi:hypothetical protein